MLTLMLLRHAKSSWADEGLDDFDRPLASRGRKAAPRVARFIADGGFGPDLILCSTARRARETLSLVLPSMAHSCTIRMDRTLYEADEEEDLGERLRTLADTDVPEGDRAPRGQRVLVIGHNPAMQDFAIQLVGSGAPDDREAIAAKFPTAALAVIAFDADRWHDIVPGSGTLTHFVRPRDLD